MSNDERAVRELIEAWQSASKAGDVPKVLSLMADDVVFMVVGQEPFGKEAFAAAARGMKDIRLDGKSDIKEITVLGDWAYCRTHLRVTMTKPDGTSTRRSGYTLSILRRKQDGAWVIARDANMLGAE